MTPLKSGVALLHYIVIVQRTASVHSLSFFQVQQHTFENLIYNSNQSTIQMNSMFPIALTVTFVYFVLVT